MPDTKDSARSVRTVRHWTTYVKNPPANTGGVLCENVFFKIDSELHYARVYRPFAVGVPPPLVVKAWLYDEYTMIKYDDGVTCYCYKVDEPIESHVNLDRYSPDDEFQLDDQVEHVLRG